MSKTYKTRPGSVAEADPLNRNLLHWKQITSCKRSRDRCCNKWRLNNDKRSLKLKVRRQLRSHLID